VIDRDRWIGREREKERKSPRWVVSEEQAALHERYSVMRWEPKRKELWLGERVEAAPLGGLSRDHRPVHAERQLGGGGG